MGSPQSKQKPVSQEPGEVILNRDRWNKQDQKNLNDKIDKLFDILDENQSKALDFKEFTALWRVIGLVPDTKATRSYIFEKYDVDKSGTIDMSEFHSFISGLNKGAGNFEIEKDDYHWGYEKHNGPDTWCHHFDAARGVCQSPIDVDMSTVKRGSDMPKITVHYKNCESICLNNSHTVVWSVEAGGHIMIGDKKFKLAQFHYHCPSEHYINGKQYPLCLHFVHLADDGTIAVLGRVFKIGKKSNKFIDAITNNKPLKANQNCKIDEIPFEAMAPAGEYVHYSGSLTTPPCSEGVLWHVKDAVDEISHAQVSWFRSCLATDNARPLQKLNDRQLVKVSIIDSLTE